ncbi:MAG TPA: hypothetical protein VEZ72_10910 [Paenibacillus sp.]|nr:hypothetical protein [Paenibacillus sp.]
MREIAFLDGNKHAEYDLNVVERYEEQMLVENERMLDRHVFVKRSNVLFIQASI